jgi:hypothetical protein
MAESKIKITAETTQAEQALQNLGGRVKEVDEKFLGLRGSLTEFSAAMSAGVLAVAIKKSIDLADSLNDLSKRTGASVETLSGLRLAAEQSGTSLEAVANGTKKLSVSLHENRDIYHKLGISTTNQTEALIQLGDVFAAMEDPVKRSALAVKIFGKSGDEMIPLLMEGSDGIRRMIERGHQLVPITAEMAKQADRFNDSLAELKLRSSDTAVILANKLLPTLNNALEQFAIGQKNADGLLDSIVTFGTINPFLSQTENIRSYTAELESLKKSRADYLAKGFSTAAYDADIEDLQKKLRYLKEMQRSIALQDSENNQSPAETRRLGMTRGQSANAGASLLKALGPEAKADPADLAITALQNEQFQKQMQLLGVLPEQVKVYQLAMMGATDAQLQKAQAAAKMVESLKVALEVQGAVSSMESDTFKKQMEALGVLPAQIKVYELAKKGATQADIEQAQAAANNVMAADARIKQQKEEEEALKYAAKATYELSQARAASLGVLADLGMQEQIRAASMRAGILGEREVVDLQVQMAQDQLDRQVQQKREALDRERQIETEKHAWSLEAEIAYQSRKSLIEEEYAARIAAVRNEADQRRLKSEVSVANISENLRKGEYGNAMSLAQQLSAGLAGHSRAAFEVNKVASLANAGIKGYQAVQAAYAHGSTWGGVAGGALEAGIALAFTAAQIDAINSTQFGGGGGGGISAPGGGVPSFSTTPGIPVQPIAAPNAQIAAPKTQVSLVLQGSQFSYSQVVDQIIPLINEAAGNGADIRVTSV